MKNFLRKAMRGFAYLAVGLLYNNPFGVFIGIRSFFYGILLNGMGKNCRVCDHVTIRGVRNIILGDTVSIHPYTLIGAVGSISIGNNCGIASHCSIIAGNHVHADINIPIKKQGIIKETIVVEEDVMIGTHATIFGNSTIGRGSFISAGAVVSGKIPPYSIVVGNPGRIISNRKGRLETKKK